MKLQKLNHKAGIAFLIAVVVFLILLGNLISPSVKGSCTRIAYVTQETRSTWKASYYSIDGTMQKVLYPKHDTITLEVETQSGSISIQILDARGSVLFEEQQMDTQTYFIDVGKKIKVVITADDHEGSFSIK